MSIIIADCWDDWEADSVVAGGAGVRREDDLRWIEVKERQDNRWRAVWGSTGLEYSFIQPVGFDVDYCEMVIKEAPSGRKYMGLRKIPGAATTGPAGFDISAARTTRWSLPADGTFKLGWWVYISDSGMDNTGFRRNRLLVGTVSIGISHFVPQGETFVEITCDTVNGTIELKHNGVYVDDWTYTPGDQIWVRPGVDASGTNVIRYGGWIGIGTVIMSFTDVGLIPDFDTLHALDVVPITVSSVLDAPGWVPSSETLTHVETLNNPLSTDPDTLSSPYVTASPEENTAKYKLDIPDFMGKIHYLNMEVRAGSAPGRTDMLQTGFTDAGEYSGAEIFDVDSNMRSFSSTVDKAPGGTGWTRSKLVDSEFWVTAKGANSDTPFPLPSKGPGPNNLAYGTETLGFYGEVSQDDFITGAYLAAACGLTKGTVRGENNPWLKFSLDGKTVFTPLGYLRESIGWEDLNNLGLVDGSKTISIQGVIYKVRLLTGAEANPTTLTLSDGDYQAVAPSATDVSEWNRLLYNVSDKNIGSESWPVNYTEEEIIGGVGSSYITWCQELVVSDTTKVIARGRNQIESIMHAGGFEDTGGAYWDHSDKKWKPVLEIVV